MKKTPFIFLTVLVALVFAGLYFINTGNEQSSNGGEVLLVGTNSGYPPFIMRDEEGAFVGFDADVMKAVAHKMGRTVRFKDMAFDALILSLQNKLVDCVIGGITISPARKKSGLFVPYYGDRVTECALFYKKRPEGSIKSIDDLVAARISVCTQAGSIFHEVLEAAQCTKLKTLGDISELVLEVMSDCSDVCLLDSDSVRQLVAQNEWMQSHQVAIPEALVFDGFGIGVAGAGSELQLQVARAVAQLRESGELQALEQAWFGTTKSVAGV